MDVIEAIQSRISVRGYKPEPVPREILAEIIDIATRSPSTMNTQPWEFMVVAGEVLDNIRRGNMEKLASGVMQNPDVPLEPFEGTYRRRQVELAIQIFELMGITREDREKRAEWQQRGLRFFDAPAAIIIFTDKSLGESYSQFDIGAMAQTICLVALNYGIGTCIEDQGVVFPEVVRKFTHIPESKRIVIAIAIGYPDDEFPANRLESRREPAENIVTWRGFD